MPELANNNAKDTIYVDVDDEITTIIDKVQASKERIVALVLPKRASVLQSIVNMKLLKRSADTAKKHLVLITSEAGLLPLAGAVGLHVASSLSSKPEIPAAPRVADESAAQAEEALLLDDEPEPEYDKTNAGERPVGELSGAAAIGAASAVADHQLSHANPLLPKAEAAKAAAPVVKKGTNKKLKVPNFNRFRLGLGLAALALVLLILFLYLAIAVLPKATVAIGTDSSNVNSSLDVKLDTTADSLNVGSGVVPATAAQQQKTYTEQANATGKQNNGDKATGDVKMTATECGNFAGNPDPVSAGTGITSNGQTYITQDDASFSFSNFKGNCATFSSNKVGIQAQQGGSNYNLSKGASFTVAGRSDVTATSTDDITGGTDNIQQIVTQSDIDGAKAKIQPDTNSIKSALDSQLKQQNLFPITATFSAGTPNITTSAQAGDAASSVTVTESITYTMLGTNRNNLVALIKDDVDQQIDTSKQTILNDGLDQATFSVKDQSDTGATVNMQTTALVGPDINLGQLKQQIAGKKSGNAQDLINQMPGVTDVKVRLSPFWVSSIPKNPNKITIKVGKAGTGA